MQWQERFELQGVADRVGNVEQQARPVMIKRCLKLLRQRRRLLQQREQQLLGNVHVWVTDLKMPDLVDQRGIKAPTMLDCRVAGAAAAAGKLVRASEGLFVEKRRLLGPHLRRFRHAHQTVHRVGIHSLRSSVWAPLGAPHCALWLAGPGLAAALRERKPNAREAAKVKRRKAAVLGRQHGRKTKRTHACARARKDTGRL